jgi:hypothetical protein
MSGAPTKTITTKGNVLKIYIAGPMTGIPDLNFPAFHAEAARLRVLGYEVINPAEINGGADELVATAAMNAQQYQVHYRKCMANDIAALLACDGIALLPNWKASRGAKLEHHIAETLGMFAIEARGLLIGPPTNGDAK